MMSIPITQEIEDEWTPVKCVEVLGGVKLPAYSTSDPALLTDFISSFQTRSDDVFVVTYPKSGTTWISEIVWQIHNEGEMSSIHIDERVAYLEWGGTPVSPLKSSAPLIKTMPIPRLLRSHLPYSLIPKRTAGDTPCKYIYLARNPKDVVVSYFEYIQSPISGYKGPFKYFCKLFVEGNVPNNLWNDHVLGWWKHRDDPNVLFLKYEDMHKDLASHLRMISEFLKKPLSDELINRITRQSTFSAMKTNAASFMYNKIQNQVLPLLRKGVVGDWKNYFTPELNERFEKDVLAKLKGSGLEFDYE